MVRRPRRGDAAQVSVFEPVGIAFEGDDFGVVHEFRRYRQEMGACPGEARPAQHWVNGPPEIWIIDR
jgi:hypothetical protein